MTRSRSGSPWRSGSASGSPTPTPPLSLPPSWPRAPLLLCSSSSRTGAVEGLISLAAWLRANGHDARLGGDTVRPGDLAEHLARARVPLVEELHLSRKFVLLDALSDLRRLTAWLRAGAPDLVLASMMNDHLLALWAARRAGRTRDDLRLVRVAHRAVDVSAGALGHRHALLRRTDGVIVHVEGYRDALVSAGFDPRRVRAIPGFVDAERFSPGASPLREAWGVPAGAPLLGIVARMKADRGHEALLRAFALVREQLAEAHLVLVGRGEHEPALRALAGPHVHFGGYQAHDALIDAYRALDLAVWLREGNDGSCRGVLEAMACGLPLVVGDRGAPPELIGARGGAGAPCGRVVDPGDPERLAAALSELLRDRALRSSLGAAARARALTFTPERAHAATLAFWRELRALPPLGA